MGWEADLTSREKNHAQQTKGGEEPAARNE